MNCKTSILDESFGQTLATVPPQVAFQFQQIVAAAVAPLLDEIAALKAEVAALKAEASLRSDPIETAAGEVHLPQQASPPPDMVTPEEIILLRGDLEATTARQDHTISVQAERLRELETQPPATGPAPEPTKKVAARTKKLDKLLLQRGKMSFSDIGKALELGSRQGKTNTRRQNMTHFSKHLIGMPDKYVISRSRHGNQRFVSLTPEYRHHLKTAKNRPLWDEV